MHKLYHKYRDLNAIDFSTIRINNVSTFENFWIKAGEPELESEDEDTH